MRCTTPSASGRSRPCIRPLNQYHVVMEVEPGFQQNPEALQQIYVRRLKRRAGPAQRLHPFRTLRTPRSGGESPGAVPLHHAFLQPGAGRRIGRCRRRDPCKPSARSACRASVQGSFQGTAQAFQASLANEPILILAALVTVYIVLGHAVRKLHSSASRFFRRCRRPAWARCWRC